MKRLLLPLFLASALPGVVQADGLLELSTADQVRDYTAVGRLELNGTGFCTGTLIATDLVLTAAHCLFERDTDIRVPLEGLSFNAGLRNGRAEATRRIRRAAIHSAYRPGDLDPVTSVSTDLALVELDQPIRNARITPLDVERNRGPLSEVALVSYAKDREDALSLERACDVLARHGSVQVLSCDVDFGASGAPVFVMQDGVPRVVAVVSAKASWDGQKVALAAGVETALDALRDSLSEGAVGARVLIPQIKPAVNTRTTATPTTGAGGGGGAKFLRP